MQLDMLKICWLGQCSICGKEGEELSDDEGAITIFLGVMPRPQLQLTARTTQPYRKPSVGNSGEQAGIRMLFSDLLHE